jgi:guanine deaminase
MAVLTNDELMTIAADAAIEGMADGRGGPFGALVAKEGTVIAVGTNQVVRKSDPTAHAEICAIRAACGTIGDHRLSGCDIFATCEPCPMCLAAIFWARIDRIYYASTRQDAAQAGFDDAVLYHEVSSDPRHRRIPMIHLPGVHGGGLFAKWQALSQKVPY